MIRIAFEDFAAEIVGEHRPAMPVMLEGETQTAMNIGALRVPGHP